MQLCASIGAKSYDVAGVRRNFGLIENHVEHVVSDRYWRP
jgi:hypothetical protein